MRKITCWIYNEQYEALTRLPTYSWRLSTTIREAIQEYIKNHSSKPNIRQLPNPNPPTTTQLFSPLYQFENGLRLAIHKFLSSFYSKDWWEISLKKRLPTIYDYAEEQKQKRDLMPWIGDSTDIEILPIHLITLGQLEEIVKAYQSDCIPELFPTMEFFLGHMECIKRIRNLFSHMVPCLTHKDTQLARGEIRALTSHINTRL